ncbi:hypothetical protein ACPPTL_18905, partial [Ralstonia pseudosolanacearum]|uniref:hypothetical protein n=1 Tax=Ralstonia pseudosolanacearum TaxID=1310165 RepID=UPI003C7A7970
SFAIFTARSPHFLVFFAIPTVAVTNAAKTLRAQQGKPATSASHSPAFAETALETQASRRIFGPPSQ